MSVYVIFLTVTRNIFLAGLIQQNYYETQVYYGVVTQILQNSQENTCIRVPF